MLDGVIFYWLGWVFWVFTTFFMKKCKRRTLLSIWILLLMICAHIQFNVHIFEINLTLIILWIGSLLLLVNNDKVVYHCFAAFTFMIGYTSILIWEKQAPVWVFGPRFILISLIGIVLVTILANGFYNRCAISIIGMCTGEMVFNFLLANYAIQDRIGTMAFLDSTFITIFLLIILEVYQNVKQRLIEDPPTYDLETDVHPVYQKVNRS